MTLGPLTNIRGGCCAKFPDLADRIDATYVMGGAVGVGGNVAGSGVGIDNEFAEWNVYCDPLAAKLVLEADVRVALVPLDATNHAPVSVAFADRLAGNSATPQAKFVRDVIAQMRESDRLRDLLLLGSARRGGAGRRESRVVRKRQPVGRR